MCVNGTGTSKANETCTNELVNNFHDEFYNKINVTDHGSNNNNNNNSNNTYSTNKVAKI